MESYIKGRQQAYLDRWMEAGRFIDSGAKVLDIGGGNLFPILLEYISSKNLDYYYLDVESEAVLGSASLGAQYGFPKNHFFEGFNDQLEFELETFDCVFSSHCIEHSIDLGRTFREVNRIIKIGGFLLMAVPLGWEENPEHPYFLTPEQWISLVEDKGFEIRVAQMACEYPENGYDLFIAAKKVCTPLESTRISPINFKKDNYIFYSFDHSSIKYNGDKIITVEGDAAHLKGGGWKIQISLEDHISTFLPVF